MTFPIPQALPWRRALVAAAALGVAGCAFQSKAPEQDVQERAQARWDALVKRDFERAWTYTDPAFRARVPQADYKARFGAAGAWKEATVRSVSCQPERCLVRVRLTTQNLVPNFASAIPLLSSEFDEAWVRQDGRWWYSQIVAAAAGTGAVAAQAAASAPVAPSSAAQPASR